MKSINFTLFKYAAFMLIISNALVHCMTKADKQVSDTSTNSTLISPEIDTNRKITGNIPQFEKVKYVKSLSAGGKLALELEQSGDTEYMKLLNAGYETPTTTTHIFKNAITAIAAPANMDHLWKPTDPRDQGLWQNVEFNRYGNKLLDVSRYSTPAHFSKNEYGNTIVHAPSDHGLQIITPAATTMTTSNLAFVEVGSKKKGKKHLK